MLRQILRDMYVDPEILAELPEEQREILYFKIRQEQIRRYYQREDEELENINLPNNFRKKRKVGILEDAKGQPWTWVFGETPGEVTVEEKWKNLYEKRMDEAIKAVIREDERLQKMRKISGARRVECKSADEKIRQIHRLGVKSESPRGSPDVTPVIQKRSQCRVSPNASPASSPGMRRTETYGVRKISNTNRVPVNSGAVRVSADAINIKNGLSRPKVKFAPDVNSHYEIVSNEKEKPFKIAQERQESTHHYDSVVRDSNENDDVMSNEEWQSLLRRFKEADARRSSAARRASLECQRQLLLASKRPNRLKKLRSKLSKLGSGNSIEKSSKFLPLPAVPKSAEQSPASKRAVARQLSKPLNRKEVIHWFQLTQLDNLKVEESSSFPGWFHGLITRLDAESLLQTKPIGNYLVRVSDKLKGYALSYKDEDRTKHFLIDASEEQCYHFFGDDQNRFDSLKELLEYYRNENISYNGEKLHNWVGQTNPSKPDYAELLAEYQQF